MAEEIDPFLPPRNGNTARRSWGTRSRRPASEKQLALLRKNGLEPPPGLTMAQASELISRIIERNQSGLSTFKQIRFLRRHHYNEPEQLTRAEAQKVISFLIASRRGWARRAAQ